MTSTVSTTGADAGLNRMRATSSGVQLKRAKAVLPYDASAVPELIAPGAETDFAIDPEST